MKMKRLLAWLLAFAMCFTFAACQKTTKKKTTSKEKEQTTASSEATTEGSGQATENAENATENTDTPKNDAAEPLLYRVTDKKGNVAWLFGSIHLGREDYYPLPLYVTNAFNGADCLAVELDIIAFEKDLSAQMQALSQLVYRDGTTIKDHISQELYDQAVDALKKYNSYQGALDYYCPAFWGSMIETLMAEAFGVDANLGIDRYLIKQAYDAEKEIVDIESAEFQYKMMAGFDDEVQELVLMSAVASYENPEQAKAELGALMDLWASGDEAAFNAYLNTVDPAMTAEEKAAYARYQKAMVTDRNINMADYAEDALASGKEVFICVGAAHVVGDGAMAELLTQRGYTVERITK